MCYFILQAYEKCFQNLHYMQWYEEHTIAHVIQAKYENTKVNKSGCHTALLIYQLFYLLHLWTWIDLCLKAWIGTGHPSTNKFACLLLEMFMLWQCFFSDLFSQLFAICILQIQMPKDFEQKFWWTVHELYLL